VQLVGCLLGFVEGQPDLLDLPGGDQ
jgi:hypothetical protein